MPSESDLVIGDPVSGDTETDVEWDETDYAAQAANLMNVFTSTYEMDYAMLSKIDQRRVDQVRRWCIRVVHADVKLLYEENFLGDVTEPEQ